jgi:hypothetical protein
MTDRWKIGAGLALFLLLIMTPVWQGRARHWAPQGLRKAAKEPCVLPRAEMRERHMDLLNDWRQAVVRTGSRQARTATGQVVRMSLTGTCLGCHESKKEFCDRCHGELGVAPDCWSCHLPPKEER